MLSEVCWVTSGRDGQSGTVVQRSPADVPTSTGHTDTAAYPVGLASSPGATREGHVAVEHSVLRPNPVQPWVIKSRCRTQMSSVVSRVLPGPEDALAPAERTFGIPTVLTLSVQTLSI